MRIGIIGAMVQEVEKLITRVDNKNITSLGNREFISGRLYQHEVVVVFSRMGKVAAASTSTTLIDLFNIELIIFTGVAGAINESLNIGDIVVGDRFVQHDMDASALPEFKRFEIPLLGEQFLIPPQELVMKATTAARDYIRLDLPVEISSAKLKEFGIAQPKVINGLIGSGDQFIATVDASTSLRSVLPDMLCVEMEGAAVAQVAAEHKVPFIIMRTISDKADHSAHLDFPKFIDQVASYFTCGSVLRLLKYLGKVTHYEK